MRKYDVFLVQRRECQSFFQVFVDFPSALFNASVQYLNEQHLAAFCACSASFSKGGLFVPFGQGLSFCGIISWEAQFYQFWKGQGWFPPQKGTFLTIIDKISLNKSIFVPPSKMFNLAEKWYRWGFPNKNINLFYRKTPTFSLSLNHYREWVRAICSISWFGSHTRASQG